MHACNGVSGMHSLSSSVSACTHAPYIHHTADTRSVTEPCWSLTARSPQLFITVSYRCCSPQRCRGDKTLSELDLPSQLVSCDEIQTLGAGSSLDTNHQSKRRSGISTSKWATAHVQSLSCTHLLHFGCFFFSRGASTAKTVKLSSKSKTSAACARTASSPQTLSRNKEQTAGLETAHSMRGGGRRSRATATVISWAG